jgi:hypothetical protein
MSGDHAVMHTTAVSPRRCERRDSAADSAPLSSPVEFRVWRFEKLWIVGSLFVLGMFATVEFVSTTGLVRLPVGIASLCALWVSQRTLSSS